MSDTLQSSQELLLGETVTTDAADYLHALPTWVETSTELTSLRLQQLTETSEELTTQFPEYLGMTLFGSVARNQTRPSSDVDIFVFFRPDNSTEVQDSSATQEHRVQKRGPVAVNPTTYFHRSIEAAYTDEISRMLAAKGVTEADVTVLPLDENLVIESITHLLHEAKIIDASVNPRGALAARNIRALFHVPIANQNLQPYINHALSRLENDPSGDTAWGIIRRQVIGLEKARKQYSYDSVAHRHIPTTIGEAVLWCCAPL